MSKIAVIYGGRSNEREISIKTKNAICTALDKLAKNYIDIELSKDIAHILTKEKIDVVINAMHGRYGEDGRLPALLDIIQIPYTHSGFKASQICMNKLLTKKLVSDLNINTPKYAVISDINNIPSQASEIMKSPFVLKPISEGSSIGVEICLEPSKFKFEKTHFAYGGILIEEYIKGQELNVVIIKDKAIGVVEVKPKHLFYDYDAKYSDSGTEYILSPQLKDNILKDILSAGQKIHNYMGCNYLSRIEFIVQGEKIYFLEINTHPGFTETSLVPKVAEQCHMGFGDIVLDMINSAKFD